MGSLDLNEERFPRSRLVTQGVSLASHVGTADRHVRNARVSFAGLYVSGILRLNFTESVAHCVYRVKAWSDLQWYN
jgi:hypothetical protein